jgi:hypothetical protein
VITKVASGARGSTRLFAIDDCRHHATENQATFTPASAKMAGATAGVRQAGGSGWHQGGDIRKSAVIVQHKTG